MSTTGRKAQGRKGKAKKQATKSSDDPVIGKIEADEYHNQSLPCCRLLQDVAQDIFATTEESDESSASHQPKRPSTLLGHMIRKMLLEQRQKELNNSETTTSKKKKKKKKKKPNKSSAVTSATSETTGENDSSALSSTASQDSQSQESVSSSTLSKAESSSEGNLVSSQKELPEGSSLIPHPVNTFLDRILEKQHRQQEKDTQGEGKTIIKNRNMEGFVKYLNENFLSGIAVHHSQLEVAAQSIRCNACRAAVNSLLQQNMKQPVVLNPIQFHHHPASQDSLDTNGNGENGNKQKSGLEVPILNQKPEQAKAQAQDHDFDYVALEEGISPATRMMETQANISGTPYFYPLTQQGKAKVNITSSAGGGSSKKQLKSNGEPSSEEKSLSWQFMSSSTTPDNIRNGGEHNDNRKPTIAVDDLHQVVKDLMIPLALPPGELMDDYTGLDPQDLKDIIGRVQELEEAFRRHIIQATNETQHYALQHRELWISDSDNNLEFKKAPEYHDLDKAIHDLSGEAILDLVWDRLLWLCQSGNTIVVRPTKMWENVVAKLADMSINMILGMLQAVKTFEHELEDISGSNGAIPHLFVSQSHRVSYRSMIETKLNLITNFIQTAERISLTEIPAMYDIGSAPPSSRTNALVVPFRSKWFTQQEFYRKVEELQSRDESDTSSPGTGPQKWIETLDFHVVDLIRGLLDFSKTILRGQVWGIKEEILIRSQKLVGLLTRVGSDVFATLLDTTQTSGQPSSANFRLLDAHLKTQCESLWNKIQEHRAYLNAVAQGEEVEGQSIDEEREIVADMAVKAIGLFRRLRKCVTDNYEYGPKNPPPKMPLKLATYLASANQSPSFPRDDPTPWYYDNLVFSSALTEPTQHQGCLGNGGQRRVISLMLALFYQRLSEQCSEWHAKLTTEELLTSMSADESLVEAPNAKKELENVHGKTNKKSKKKKEKKASAADQDTKGTTSENKSTEPPQKNGVSSTSTSAAGTVPQTSDTNNSSDGGRKSNAETSAGGADSSNPKPSDGPSQDVKMKSEAGDKKDDNGLQPMNGTNNAASERKKKGKKVSEASGAKETGDKVDTKPESKEEISPVENGSSDGQKAPSKPNGKAKPKSVKGKKNGGASAASTDLESALADVDKNLGVQDGAGAFHTAESYLVGRLNALLKKAGGNTSGGKKTLIGGEVVIVL